MLFKPAYIIAALAVVKGAVAATPACFLAAINTQDSLSDYETICKDNASDVQTTIQKVCTSDNVQAALSAFSDACKNKGYTVAAASIISSASTAASTGSSNATRTAAPTTVVYTSAVYDSSCSCSKTEAFTSVIPAATGVTTTTRTGSAGSSATGASASSSAAGSNGASGRTEGSIFGSILALGVGLLAML